MPAGPPHQGTRMAFPVPPQEAGRLAALREAAILDTPPSPAFDRVCRLVQEALGVPIVLVSLIDQDRQWFKARLGLDVSETPRDLAFCNYTILHDSVFVVPDALADRRFAHNALVTGEPHIRFYAGAPLHVERDLRLGSLCAIDTKPRSFSSAEGELLAGFARLAVDELWVHVLERRGFVDAADAPEPHPGHADFSLRPALTSAQIRAARGLLNWSVRELAEAAGVSPMTVKRLEAGGPDLVREDSVLRIRRALEAASVEFVFAAGAKPGVRPR